VISLIEGLPDDVVGIVATGKVTRNDCDRVLVPAVQKTLSRHDKIRLYYELSSRFPGAAWDDLQVLEPLPQWARIAVVTDVGWIRHTVNALRFLIPGDIRVFAAVQAQEGRDWIAADPP
jgi:stage II sporulation SpoAA-like protein